MTAEGRVEKIPEDLQPFTLRCSGRGRVWLVGGMRKHNFHQCKPCSHSFAVKTYTSGEASDGHINQFMNLKRLEVNGLNHD